jgi:hypothetical protein
VRIEFAVIGDGTNVQVSLIDEKEPGWGIVDRFYTASHEMQVTSFKTEDVPFHAKATFEMAEAFLAPPVIGGQFAPFHPYWKEREQARARRTRQDPVE